MKKQALLVTFPFGAIGLMVGGMLGGKGAFWLAKKIMELFGLYSPLLLRVFISLSFIIIGVGAAILILKQISMINRFRDSLERKITLRFLAEVTMFLTGYLFILGVSMGIGFTGFIAILMTVL